MTRRNAAAGWKPRHLLEMTAPGLNTDLSTSHSLQFETKRQTHRFLMKVLDVGDYIFISPGFRPLWSMTTEGLVLSKSGKELELLERVVSEHSIKGAEEVRGTLTTETWVKNGVLELVHERGFRVDKDWIWTTHRHIVHECSLQIGPSSTSSRRNVYFPKEIFTPNPVKDFLSHLLPGDYATVWSERDSRVNSFMHYPVQGWVTAVDPKTRSFSYVHPPRMNIQTWRFDDNPNCQHTMGFYRKLVIQCANPQVEEDKFLPPR